jgi:hypothetical protein
MNGIEWDAYAIPAATETANPSLVQKFADKPVEAKLAPSFAIVGCSESLSLLSKLLLPFQQNSYIINYRCK